MKEGGFSFVEYADAGGDTGAGGGVTKSLDGLMHGLVGEAEGSVVHGNHGARTEVEEGLDCVFRAGVHAAEAVWVIGADGQQRDLR